MSSINTIFNKLESSSEICTCQDAMYLHRLYLNIEHSIEIYFKQAGKIITKSASYHKDLLIDYFKELGLEKSDIFTIVDELRGFRHIFNKRADILEFLSQSINILKDKILKFKDKIIEQFGEI